MVLKDDVNEVLERIEKNTENVDNFLSVHNEITRDQLNCCKILFDCSRTLDEQNNDNCLPSLFLDDFDLEQVWQQIELINKNWPVTLKKSIKDYKKSIKKQKIDKYKPATNVEDVIDDDDKNLNDVVYDDDEDDDDDDDDVDEIIEKEKNKLNIKLDNRSTEDGLEDCNEDDNDGLNDDEDDDEDDDDLDDGGDDGLDDLMKDSDDEKVNDDEIVTSLDDAPNYDSDADYDRNVDDDNNNDINNDINNDDINDDDNNDDINDDDEEDEEEEEEETDNFMDVNRELIRDDDNDVKSTFERRQELLHKRINELEEKTITEKPWQLKGEVAASNRPINSLMEEALDFETATKPAMLITDEVNKTIEDKIIQRLKDKIWDGPKRKIKTKDQPFNLKKVVLSDEKSQMSLEKIYEQEYLYKAQKDEEKLPQEIEELKQSMSSLFRKLDALCNFHFTPKPSIPEVEIVTNNPAIYMEDVAPVAVSEATTLAPEEIVSKPKKLLGSTERTKTDKKSELRSKKKRQHHERLEREFKEKIKKIKIDKRESLHKSLTDIHSKEKEKVRGKVKKVTKKNKK